MLFWCLPWALWVAISPPCLQFSYMKWKGNAPKPLLHVTGTQGRKSPNSPFDITWVPCHVTGSRWVDTVKPPGCIQTIHYQHIGLFQTHITGVRLSEGSSSWTKSLGWFHFAKCFSRQPTRLLLSIQHFIFYTEINGKIPMIFKGRVQPWVRM